MKLSHLKKDNNCHNQTMSPPRPHPRDWQWMAMMGWFSIFTHLLWAALPVSQRPVGLSTTSQFSLHPSSYFASIDIIFGMCIFICLAVHKRQKSTLNIFQYYLIKIAFKINLHFERTGTILISKITFLMCSVSQNVCSDKLFHSKHIVWDWARPGRSIRPLIDIVKEGGRRNYAVTGAYMFPIHFPICLNLPNHNCYC